MLAFDVDEELAVIIYVGETPSGVGIGMKYINWRVGAV